MSKLPKIDQNEKPEIPIIARFKGPGPAAYTLQTTISNENYNGKTAPSYSFGMKLKPQKITPGPNEFTPIALRNGVASAPAYSIAGRNFPHKKETQSPGPASYSYSNYYQSKCKSSPAYSLLGRHDAAKLDVTPSPAAYSTNRKVGSDTPAWTMRPSLPKKQIQSSPGPAEYNAVNCNVIKKAPPAYSLHSRLTSNDNFTLPKGKLSKEIFLLFNL
ncbi:hypothetical protein PIROE2DRAFT_3032 [Piromyces sp. E2]|nr:hypothetical protein PIROE2DRAFT_3032 [Piromyces sp. E2]|eukprot:OUM69135.1 hypothetical protein PIROE2DRAFT_3032 [Piromyces sp. E2]